MIDVRAVLQVAHRDVVLSELPPLLLPHKGTLGLIDYEKTFCADPRPGRDIFDLRRIGFWQQIGDALGVTRQSVHTKYSKDSS